MAQHHKRWYDRLPELAQAVRMLEELPPEHRLLIADVIARNVSMHEVMSNKNFIGLKEAGEDKVMGLLKSKSKRRWYDKDPALHQAFNAIYMMDDVGRYEIAMKIIIAINALKEASSDPSFQNKDPAVVKSIFNQQLIGLMEKTKFTVKPTEVEPEPVVASVQAAPAAEVEPPKPPEPEPAPKEPLVTGDKITESDQLPPAVQIQGDRIRLRLD